MSTIDLVVNVTQADIDDGGHDAHCCPHQRAIVRALSEAGHTGLSVCLSASHVRVYKDMCAGVPTTEPPLVAREWIINYDLMVQRVPTGDATKVIPITYSITLLLPE